MKKWLRYSIWRGCTAQMNELAQAQEPSYQEVQVRVLDNRAGMRASARKTYAVYSRFGVSDLAAAAMVRKNYAVPLLINLERALAGSVCRW